MAVSPKLPGTTPKSKGTPQQGSTASQISMPPIPRQNMIRTQSKSSTQDRLFSSASSLVPPKPFIQTSTPTLIKDTSNPQTPPAAATTKSANSKVSGEQRKILLYMGIVFVVVLLIVVFIALKIFEKQSSGSTIDQHYAIMTQVCNCQAPIR